MSSQVKAKQILTPDQIEFLSHVTMVDLPDGQGGFVRTARISGINVQIVSGLDATNGYSTDLDSIAPLILKGACFRQI